MKKKEELDPGTTTKDVRGARLPYERPSFRCDGLETVVCENGTTQIDNSYLNTKRN